MKDFIDNLNRDKARGNIAPHQIILLLSLQKLYLENKSHIIHISDLMDTFSSVWEEHQNSFKTKNSNLGMPLKVFVNKDYIEIKVKVEINDFRSKTELKSKVTRIVVNRVLLRLFKNTEFSAFLKKRISN
ncbi:hypothetical protein [Cellulophaga baltica]|uniref:hypothetical protein n=1 Tax=Cellulophaga baltica TaxID=76594 RepID=UPI002495159C|nr:hypothetical protein [Cellulophaga baltica]